MARRTAEQWAALLEDYAKAYSETEIKPQAWVEQNLEDGAWGSAKRHITAKKAKELIASGGVKQSAKSAKKSANSQKASTQSANSAKKSRAKDSPKSSKPLINKGKEKVEKSKSNTEKAESKRDKPASKSHISKRPHGAQSQEGDWECENSQLEEPEVTLPDDEPAPLSMCGARTRRGTRCEKQSGWGTTHFGTGRCRLHGGAGGGAIGNSNATIHGIYSQYLDDDEQAIFKSGHAQTVDLSNEIAFTRIEMKRCMDRMQEQRSIIGGESGYFDKFQTTEMHTTVEDGEIKNVEVAVNRSMTEHALEFESHEYGLSGEGLKDVRKFKVVDYGEIMGRLMGRLLNLIRQQHQSATYVPKEELAEFSDYYLGEYEADRMTAKEVAVAFGRMCLPLPKVIEIVLKSELEGAQGEGEGERLEADELDALVERERAKAKKLANKNLKGREEIIAKMMRNEPIEVESSE